MGLKWKMTAYKEVDYEHLNEFINEEFPVFKRDFSVAYVEEWSNDSCYIINVNGKINEYEQKELNEILATGKLKNNMTELLLNHLCQRGAIEKGAYLIKVSW